MNAKVIAIAMQKGGVGKTTTCANLGIDIAQEGKKVLLKDANAHGGLFLSDMELNSFTIFEERYFLKHLR